VIDLAGKVKLKTERKHMSEDKVTIAGKEYFIAPLKLKYLKLITEMLKEPAPTAIYESLSRFFPFIAASIQEKQPDFKVETIDEGTLDEINTAWAKIIDHSGIKIVPKLGETKPAATDSIGTQYTAA
jgi:hypothetical protein